ncbi:CoA transferase [Bradyrhizobium brasilense]|uniref:CaiB/BaiF CoA transferase family protein n=1 Tax=Bradyrhizobium brasilense TaxID=1419277 RepID=UPI0028773828|nr:CoA transferase [Bradyrhizobium brasilense]MCP3417942.1 CoA transferase [Bradyrhizobium brasilense]
MTLPLNGIRVLDLSRALAGPFCAMILGDLGADVVKVEPLPDGEMIRGWGPFDHDISTYYLSVNRNKRSLALNFRDSDGIDAIRTMAANADVLIENFKPGAMEAMGLSFDSLRATNPGLIYANVTGFGRDGPYGEWPGLDQIALGMSGLMSVTGTAESGPLRMGVPIGDMLAGMWIALGVQAALIERSATGQGQRVETSLLAGLVGMLCLQGQRFLSLGEIPKPAGNDHPVIVPYGTFHAKDGPFNMAAATDAMWRKLCQLLDLRELAEHPDFKDNTARSRNKTEVQRRLNEKFSARPRMDWVKELIALGLPSGPIYNIAEVFEDPQVKHLKLEETVQHPVLGALRQLASPIRLDAMTGHSVRLAPPTLGQHSEAAMRDFGIDSETIERLCRSGTVKQEGR